MNVKIIRLPNKLLKPVLLKEWSGNGHQAAGVIADRLLPELVPLTT